MSTALATRPDASIGSREMYTHGVSEVIARIDAAKAMMAKAMTQDVDFGVIPGTGEKPTLLKPGAEKIAVAFGLTHKTEQLDRYFTQNGVEHLEVKSTTELADATGRIVSTGVGSCSTMESKYRWRSGEAQFEPTGEPVPKTYWELFGKDKTEAKKMLVRVYGDGAGPKKIDGDWQVVFFRGNGDKVENVNVADQFNTVRKMAKKRSLVDAILSCGLSGMFTQDVEDIDRDEKPAPHTTKHEKAQQAQTEAQAAHVPPPVPAVPYDGDAMDYIAPVGKHKGKKLRDFEMRDLQWYAQVYDAKSDIQKQFRAQAEKAYAKRSESQEVITQDADQKGPFES